MNAVDATDRETHDSTSTPPSVLTIILDTNPHAWSLLSEDLPLSKILATLLVFINAHLAISDSNRVTVIASHVQRAQWLYPTPDLVDAPSDSDVAMQDADTDSLPSNTSNKFRPFATVEHALTTNLRKLMASTNEADLESTPSTMMSGALTMALAYLSKLSNATPSRSNAASSYDTFNNATNDGIQSTSTTTLTSRILIVSVSGDLASQYISIMNGIFACQRLNIPIDILKLAGDNVFLQQAADATGGIYIAPSPLERKGILQYLMMAYLPDQTARQALVEPGEAEGVDFRAACFCHRKVVDIGYVCSICLSIFCEPLTDNACLTCGTHLKLANYGTTSVVVPKKKAKKKKRAGDMAGDTAATALAAG